MILILPLKIVTIVLRLNVAVAYMTLAERKVMAAMQRRKGPNVVGVLAYYSRWQML